MGGIGVLISQRMIEEAVSELRQQPIVQELEPDTCELSILAPLWIHNLLTPQKIANTIWGMRIEDQAG